MGTAPDPDGDRSASPAEPDPLVSRVRRAGFWSFGVRVSVRVLQLVRTIILARLLSPEDFGLMGFAVIALLLVDTFSQTGFSQALIQSDEPGDDQYDTAWTIEVGRGILLAGILWAAAPLVGAFFGSAEVVPIIRVLTVSVAVRGLTSATVARLHRDLRFDRIFIFELAERLTEVVVGIAAAVVLRSVWALVFGVLAGSVARVVASFVVAPHRPRLFFSRATAGHLVRYGRWIFGTIVLWFLTSELDDILVGRMLGSEPLGLYRMAYTISQAMLTELAQAVNSVAFPAFALIRSDPKRLAAWLGDATHLVAFIAFPAAAAFVVLGRPLTIVLLGEDWLPMVPALAVLSVAGAARAVSAVASIMFEGAGQPRISTRLEVLRLGILAGALYPMISAWGLVGAGIATVTASLVADTTTLLRAVKFVGTPVRELLRTVVRPLVHGVVAGVAAFAAVGGAASGIGDLVTGLVVGALVYGGLVMVGVKRFDYREASALYGRLRGVGR